MAEDAEEGGGEAPAGGGVLKKYGPLAVVVLLAQVVLAWVLIQVTVGDQDLAGSGDTGEDLIPTTELTTGGVEETTTELPFQWGAEELAKVTANPAGTNSQRFAVISVELGLTGANEDGAIPTKDLAADVPAIELLVAKKGLIRAVIIEVMRSKTIDQLESEVIGEVKDEIRRKLNQRIFDRIAWDEDDNKKISVAEVIFTGIIVQ